MGGGAGGQHACKVADELGMETVLVHPLAGILSAYGIGLAPVKAIREVSLVQPLGSDISEALGSLERDAREVLARQGIAGAAIRIESRARLHFEGSDSMLIVDICQPAEMDAAFRQRHRQRGQHPGGVHGAGCLRGQRLAAGGPRLGHRAVPAAGPARETAHAACRCR